jgi:bifunctional DNA-binding transcriptional regulator/antitoxin component of YhaV-PrlF toxin-antitoxin module
MTITIAMTSNGQFTLPVEVRRALTLDEKGDKLTLDFNPAKQQAILSKPISIEDIQKRAKKYIKPGTKPVTDASAFFETREPRL